MYQIQYSIWNEKDFPGFQKKLVDLEEVSKAYYRDTAGGNLAEAHSIDTFLHDFEYYYLALFKAHLITKENFRNVLDQIKKVVAVKVLPKDARKYFALTYQNQIYINPDLKPVRSLTPDDMHLMVHSHELGHVINNQWVDASFHYANTLYQNPRVQGILRNMGLSSASYLKDGFCLLDEVVVQDVAERVTYLKKGQARPLMESRNDKAIFGLNSYRTNFNLYGEFQEIAVRFARTLSFLHCEAQDSDDEVLRKLDIAAFRGDFVARIERELEFHPDKIDSFVILLATMGKIKDSTYQIIGLSASKGSSVIVNSYLSPFEQITDSYTSPSKKGY